MTTRVLALALCLSAALTCPVLAQVQDAGFSEERLDRIGDVLDREIENDVILGAVTLIARDGDIVHLEAHGFLDDGKTRPMQTDSLFRAFSMTKPVVSVAAMMLVEEGRMSLRDPVETWLPELAEMSVVVAPDGNAGDGELQTEPAKADITVYDLLRHTSGFTYSNSAPFKALGQAYLDADVEAREGDLSPETFLERLADIPLAYQPSTRWEYGVSTDVLGVLVERVSGQRLDQFLEERIFSPLKMDESGFQLPEGAADRLADAYDADPQKAGAWQWVRVEEDPGKRYRLGGAAMVTTAEDYFRFAQMMVNRGELDGVRLLSAQTVDHMLADHVAGLAGSPRPTTGPGYGFGLGFGVRLAEGGALAPGSQGDAMWAGAGGTSFTIDPQERLVGVFMAAAPSPRQHTRFLFKTLLYGAMVE